MEKWIKFSDTKPEANGYYLIQYLHKDGNKYCKGIWWNGKEFRYKDYVKEVYEYTPKRYDYYVPCMLQEEG